MSYSGRKWRAPSSCPGALTWYTQKCRKIGCISVKLKNPWKHVMSKNCWLKAFRYQTANSNLDLICKILYFISWWITENKIWQFAFVLSHNQLNLEERFFWLVTKRRQIFPCMDLLFRPISWNVKMASFDLSPWIATWRFPNGVSMSSSFTKNKIKELESYRSKLFHVKHQSKLDTC